MNCNCEMIKVNLKETTTLEIVLESAKLLKKTVYLILNNVKTVRKPSYNPTI